MTARAAGQPARLAWRCLVRVTMLAGLAVPLAGFAFAVPAPATITIDNFSFVPAALTVAVGSTITWRNRDDIPHTVTGQYDGKLVRSPPMDTDDSFTATFPTAGVFHYFCSLHPHMQGSVTVH